MRKAVMSWMTVLLLLWFSQSAPASHWITPEGQSIDPIHNPHRRAAVLFFVAIDCPSSNGYAPTYNALVKQYSVQDVAFYLVHEDEDATAKELRKHDVDYGYTCPVVLDRDHAMARRFHIKVTPEVAVLDAAGHELYHGRIDDRYFSCGSSARQTSHDLVDALSAVLAGRAVAHAAVPGAGCSIYFKP